ncbi:hypothetical protein AB0C02_27110 [Micromonospora sp. NPDC048999]|uniref:hypothetical protein n=1 Tax=Micromonospora sp. NPDC048999 TaxID=3155391 RepID=UPI00340BA2BF
MTTATRDFLYGGMYLAACRFANIELFVERVAAEIDLDAPADAASAAATIRDLVEALPPEGPIQDDEAALRKLIADDLRAVAAARIPDADTPVGDRIVSAASGIRAALKDAGLDLGDADLHVMDEFPPPFDQFGWAAFTPDREDEQRYGIPTGVSFRRGGLRPLYSEALLAHELIHTVPGRIDPEIQAMGLEEGIAEVLGTCFAAATVVPPHALRNVLTYGRHGVERPKLWSLYRDHTRQAFLLYLEFGIDGLVELANRGRAKIHETEAAVFAGTYRSLDLPRGTWNDNTTWLLGSFCNGFVPSHVFTPLEVVLIDHVDEQRSLSEVCRRANVPDSVGVPVLRRLGSESALFIRDGDDIGYSNVQHYLRMSDAAGQPAIRYLPPRAKARQE